MPARDYRQHGISRHSFMPLRRITWSVRKYTDGSWKGAAINSFGLALAENGLPERWTRPESEAHGRQSQIHTGRPYGGFRVRVKLGSKGH